MNPLCNPASPVCSDERKRVRRKEDDEERMGIRREDGRIREDEVRQKNRSERGWDEEEKKGVVEGN